MQVNVNGEADSSHFTFGRLDVCCSEHWMVMVVPQRMNRKLQILHLEDDPDFAEWVRSLFARRFGGRVECVGDRAAFEAALDAVRLTPLFRTITCRRSPAWMRWPWCEKNPHIRSFSFPAPSANSGD